MPIAQLAVVSYPRLADADRRWIESLREAHDPLATLLAAHFTLVFPADVGPADVAAEIAAAASSVPPVSFVIRSAKAVRDVFRPGGHVLLVPKEGAEAITGLNRDPRTVAGTLETLDLVELANGIVSPIGRFNLGSSRAS